MKRCLTLTISDTANLITRWRHLHFHIVKICSIGAITWYWMSKNLYWSDLHQLSAHSMHGLACETLERTPGLPGYNEKLLSKLENQRDTECRRHGSRKFDWILCSLAPGSVHTKLLESTISGGRRLCGKYCFGKMVMTLLNFKAFLHSRLQSIVVMFSLSTLFSFRGTGGETGGGFLLKSEWVSEETSPASSSSSMKMKYAVFLWKYNEKRASKDNSKIFLCHTLF